MTTDSLLIENEGPVCIVTVNRSKRRNAVDGPMAAALREEGRAGVRIVHEEGLEGAGRFARDEGRHGSFS